MAISSDIRGLLHAPYFIFVRCSGSLTDAELLEMFGIASYRLVASAERLGQHASIADAGEWTMLSDSWGYTLWHLHSSRQAVFQLAQNWDVFACSVGDTDSSYHFEYYRGAQLVRRYVVIDPHWRGGEVYENLGMPLSGEAAAFKESDELSRVLSVAQSLGIPLEELTRSIRVYRATRPDAV